MSTLVRIRHSRSLYTFGLDVKCGGHYAENSIRKSLNSAISREIIGEHEARTDFHVILESTPLISWRGMSFPTTTQMLYRLKSNCFTLWNCSLQDLPSPDPEYSAAVPEWQVLYSVLALAHDDTRVFT